MIELKTGTPASGLSLELTCINCVKRIKTQDFQSVCVIHLNPVEASDKACVFYFSKEAAVLHRMADLRLGLQRVFESKKVPLILRRKNERAE